MFRFTLLLILTLLAPPLWAANTLDVSLSIHKLILTPRHGGDGSAWGFGRCESCHVLNLIHGDAPKIRDIVKDKGFDTCGGCHGDNGAGLPRPCLICHNSSDLPASPLQSGQHKHNFASRSANAELRAKPLNDSDCLVCHEASDMNGEFDNNVDLTLLLDKVGAKTDYRNGAEFCVRCHNRDHQQPGFPITGYDYRDPLIAMADNYLYLDVHGKRKGSGQRTYAGLRDQVYQYGTVVECVDCHAMHGTNNSRLIIDSSASGVFRFNEAFRNQPIRVDTRGNNYAQLCVICHAMQTPVEDAQKNTGNGLSGVHQISGDCSLCHAHGMAAQTGL